MLNVVEPSDERIIYPVARKNVSNRFTVLFFSEKHGVVIDRGPTILVRQGETSSVWTSCHDSEYWEPVEITITG